MRNPHYFMNHELPEDDTLSDAKARLLRRIEGYESLGLHKEAIDECKSLVRIDLNDPASVVELGVQYELRGETGEAVKNLEYGIKKFPGYFRTYVALGYWFERYRGRTDMAMLCYEKALDLNPNDEWAFYNIGRMLHYSGKWGASIPYYEKSYEACKREGLVVGRTLHGLAWAYYRLKDYEKALVLFVRIVEENPGYFDEKNDARADFGCVYYKLGRYAESVALLEESVIRQLENKRNKRLYNLISHRVASSSELNSHKNRVS